MQMFYDRYNRTGTTIHCLDTDTGNYLTNNHGLIKKYYIYNQYIDESDSSNNFWYYVWLFPLCTDNDNNLYTVSRLYRKLISSSAQTYLYVQKLSLDNGTVEWTVPINSGYMDNKWYTNYYKNKWYQDAVKDGYLYIVMTMGVFCYNTSNGAVRWTYESSFYSADVMPDGNILIDNRKCQKSDGSVIYSVGSYYASYSIDSDGNYYTLQNYQHTGLYFVTKYDGSTGTLLWNIPLGDIFNTNKDYIYINPYNQNIYLNRYKTDNYCLKYCEGDY
jgi:hypothetical protein